MYLSFIRTTWGPNVRPLTSEHGGKDFVIRCFLLLWQYTISEQWPFHMLNTGYDPVPKHASEL
jgi:hypothetical protein